MNKYLRSWIVLIIDMFISVLASAMLLGLYILLSGPGNLGREIAVTWLCAAFVGSLIAFLGTRVYKTVIRHSTLRELANIAVAVLFKEIISGAVVLAMFWQSLDIYAALVLLCFDFAITFSALVIVRVMMVVLYRIWNRRLKSARRYCNILIYGVGNSSAALAPRLINSDTYRVEGFLVPSDNAPSGNSMSELPILKFKNEQDISRIISKYNIEGVLFSSASYANTEKNRLVEYGRELGLKLLIAPAIDELSEGKPFSASIRKIKIEDLLGRTEIGIAMEAIRNEFKDKVILVTGAAGSIGSELCRQLAQMGIKQLIMYDNAETPLHNVRLSFNDTFPGLNFVPVIGDVRLVDRLDMVFRRYKPQVVFHAAAYKHVPLMEENPCEAVLVNVIGSKNVADKCMEYGVEKMVMVSTDKAVNPTNIMGCTKRLAEIYVQSLGLAVQGGKIKGNTTFVTTRFGNVLGSNGSVIPRFQEQIERGGPVTVTDPEIRRFFMTIPEACRLVMEAATMSKDTEIFVFDMGTPVKIADLAKKMIELAGYEVDKDIKIEYTGLRPGEKLYEEVLATTENTIPTPHDKIFVAKVRKYDYNELTDIFTALDALSRQVEIPDMVKLMKKTVPEFKSKNSEFEIYDIEEPSEDKK